MKRAFFIEFIGETLRATAVTRRHRGVEMRASEPAGLQHGETSFAGLLGRAMKDAGGRARERVVLIVPRHWCLIVADASGSGRDPREALPPLYADAFTAPILRGRMPPARAILDSRRWKTWADDVVAAGHKPHGAVVFLPLTEEGRAAFFGQVLSGQGPWLVPAPSEGWRRVRWTRSLERGLAAAAGLIFILGTFAGRAAETARDERVAAESRVRRSANSSSAAVFAVAALPLLSDLADRFPAKAHLVDLTMDAATKRTRLRGRASDYGDVSSLGIALSSHPAVAACRTEKSMIVRVGERSVVEFAVEMSLR